MRHQARVFFDIAVLLIVFIGSYQVAMAAENVGNGTPPLLRKFIHFDTASDENRLYVIIGRNTFSASHNLITDLDWIAEPVFAREPSGSRPNTLSKSGNFVLPYSRLSGVLSSQLHQQS